MEQTTQQDDHPMPQRGGKTMRRFQGWRRVAVALMVALVLSISVAWAAGGDDLFGFISGRVYFGASNGSLGSSSSFTYSSSTSTLSVPNLSVSTSMGAGTLTTLHATGTTMLDGAVTLGDAAADAITVTGTVAGSVSLTKEANHTLSVVTSTTTNAAGGALTIAAGTAAGNGTGGALTLNAGGTTSGTQGSVLIGAATTAGVTITPATTITGLLTADGGISGAHNGTVGAGTPASGAFTTVAASDTVTLQTLGKSIQIKEGSNAKMGVASFNGAGWVTVNTTAVGATSRVFVTGQSSSGACYVKARVAGTSFDLYSTDTSDSGDAAWVILDPAP